MNGKKYKKFFAELCEKGDIPEELCASLTERIDRDKKLTWESYGYYLAELEKRRRFEVDGTPFETKNSAKTDGTYVYKRPKNPFWHMAHAICATIYKFVGWLASVLVYGVWRIPDRKKLKGVKACISVSNHIGYIDAGLTRYAFGTRKQYTVAAPHNCKNNFGGFLLKSATVIPLPSGFRGMSAFNDMLGYVFERGANVHFYAEKSMWLRYKKPRPLMDGPFHYADKFDVPIVPMFYAMVEPKGLRKLLGLPKAKVCIAEPLYVDRTLPPKERKLDLKRRTEAAMRKLYEDFYGEPLEYLPEYKEAEGADNTEPVAEAGNDLTETSASQKAAT